MLMNRGNIPLKEQPDVYLKYIFKYHTHTISIKNYWAFMKIPILPCLFFMVLNCSLLSFPVFGQNRNTSVLAERLIDRPLMMHKGQVQLLPSYSLYFKNNSWNDKGDKTGLQQDGLSVLCHSFQMRFAFGITNHIELFATGSYLSENERLTNSIDAGWDNLVSYGGNIDTRGIEDVTMGVNLMAPFKTQNAGIAAGAGIIIPAGGNQPEQPAHVWSNPHQSPGSYDVQYHFLNRPGEGVWGGLFNLMLKAKLDPVSVRAYTSLQLPLSEGEGIEWQSRLLNQNFEYLQENYRYGAPQKLFFKLNADVQVFPWFSTGAGLSAFRFSKGWREYNSNFYALPDVRSMAIHFDAEVQATSMLRIFQSFSLPLAGRNIESGLLILTGLSLNFLAF